MPSVASNWSSSARCAAVRLRPGKGAGHPRHHDLDPSVDGMGLEPRLGRVCCDRLLDEEHPVLPGEPRHQMLRTLVDEVPAEMREAKQSRRHRHRARLSRRGKMSGSAIPETAAILFDIDLMSPGPTHSACPPSTLNRSVGASWLSRTCDRRPGIKTRAGHPSSGPRQVVRITVFDCIFSGIDQRSRGFFLALTAASLACTASSPKADGRRRARPGNSPALPQRFASRMISKERAWCRRAKSPRAMLSTRARSRVDGAGSSATFWHPAPVRRPPTWSRSNGARMWPARSRRSKG